MNPSYYCLTEGFSPETCKIICILSFNSIILLLMTFYMFVSLFVCGFTSKDVISVSVFVERMGKVAPSVFSGVRTGAETSLDHKPKASGGSVFSK